jgi:immune inhibitor A
MTWSTTFCAVSASPELRERVRAAAAEARRAAGLPEAGLGSLMREPRRLGFNDGTIRPPSSFPPGTSRRTIRNAAADRSPLRGAVRVFVVLIDFPDRGFGEQPARFQDLFFSTGVVSTGSVTEYYRDVTGGLVEITGEVVGPLTMPQPLSWYANGNFGIGNPSGEPRANIMAQDAVKAADPVVNLKPYDNDGDGYVDAFVIVHAGRGGEETGDSSDIWSHKWVLPEEYDADGTKVYGYLTIPEDAKLGVSAHELGHLLFGFPDLYDTDYTSEGIGNWCLMAGGSWNGGGDIPAHPSAWCKVQQGWAAVTNVTTGGPLSIPDVKTSRNVHRLWKDGTGGSEYFLLENRQRTGYDSDLPGDGLLIWHIDEAQPGNTDENHYKVGLMQADGNRDLELDHNRGDAGDPYPGSSGNASFTKSTTPNSLSYANQDTCVAVTAISASGPTMSATAEVACGKATQKELKDFKDLTKDRIKDYKELNKDRKDLKDRLKDLKELTKERKDLKDMAEGKQFIKDLRDGGGGKGPKELVERPGGGGWLSPGMPGQGSPDVSQVVAQLEERLATVEAALGIGGEAQAFIGGELRPDLMGGPEYSAQGDLHQRMAGADRDAKIAFDTLPQQ